MSSQERLDERFELEARIGSGGMGEVFRARDPVTGEVVAIKILPGSQGPLAERFTREIEMLAELDHPGIVRYISHGVTPAGGVMSPYPSSSVSFMHAAELASIGAAPGNVAASESRQSPPPRIVGLSCCVSIQGEHLT